MEQRIVSIRVTADGKAYVVDMEANARATQAFGAKVAEAAQDLKGLQTAEAATAQAAAQLGTTVQEAARQVHGLGQAEEQAARAGAPLSRTVAQASAEVKTLGASAAETAAAVRQLPAQLADVAATAQVSARASAQLGTTAQEAARQVQGLGQAEEQAARAGAPLSSVAAQASADVKSLGASAAQTAAAMRQLPTQLADVASTAQLSTTVQEAARQVQGLGQAKEQAAKAGAPLSKTAAQASADVKSLGISAGQTAAAMRMLPAQLTDVVTQLAGGQSPFLVLLQQGGQVKDSFGGIGHAARALAGLVTPARAAVAGFALAASAVALAYYQGSRESDAYVRGIVMTGNAAGVTSGQLAGMAKAVSGTVGTQAAAADALAQLTSTGKVGRDNLQAFAQTAVQAERSIGQSVGDTVAAFADLAKAPVQASLKLNESLNYLTAETYKQIKAAEDLGRVEEAAALAQQAYAAAMDTRSRQLVGQLGSIERAWRAVKDGAASAWDAMLDIGRKETTADALSRVSTQLERRRENAELYPHKAESLEKGTEKLREQQAVLQEMVRLEKRGAEAAAEKVEKDKAKLVLAQALEGSLSKQEKLAQALAKANAQADAAGATPQERAKLIAGVQRQYGETVNRGLDAQLERWRGVDKAILAERASFFDRLRTQEQLGQKSTLDVVGETADKEFEVYLRRTAVLQQQLEALKKKQNTEKEQIAVLNQIAETEADYARKSAALHDQATVFIDKRRKAVEALLAAERQAFQDETAQHLVAQSKAFEQASEAVYGHKNALAESARALAVEHGAALLSEKDRAIAIEQYRIRIDLEKRLNAIRGNLYLRPEQREELEKQERANAVKAEEQAVSRVRLAEWSRTTGQMDETFREGFRAMLFRGEGAWGSWTKSLKKTFQATVADELYKMFARPFVVNVLAKVSGALGLGGNVAGVAPGGGGIGGTLQTASNLHTLYGAANQWLTGSTAGASTASLAYANTVGLAGGDSLGALIAANGNWASVGTTIGTTAASTFAGSGALSAGIAETMSAIGIETLASGAAVGTGAAGSAAAGAAASGAAGGGAMAGLAAIPVWGWVAMAVALIASMAGKGETRQGAQYGYAFDGVAQNPRRGTTVEGYKATFLEGPSGGDPLKDRGAALINETVKGINDMLKGLGSKASLVGFQAGFETSEKGRGGVFAGGKLSTGQAFGESGEGDNYAGTLYESTSSQSPNAEEAVKNFSTDLMQATLQALQAAEDIPQAVKDKLKEVDAETVSAEHAADLVAQIQQVSAFTKAVKELPFENLKNIGYDAGAALIEAGGGVDRVAGAVRSYFDHFTSDSEKTKLAVGSLGRAFEEIGQPVPASKQAFAELVQAQDLTTAAGRKTWLSLMDVSQAFLSVQAVTDAQAKQTESLQIAVLRAEGKELQALAIERKNELAGMAEVHRPLQQRLYDLQDEARATEERNRAAQELGRTQGLEAQLLRLQGNEAGALALERARELEGLTETQRSIQQRIHALQDERSALEVRQQDLNRQIGAMKDQWGDLGSVMQELNPGARKLVDTWRDGVKNAQALSEALDQALGRRKLSSVEELTRSLGMGKDFQGAAKNAREQIYGLTLGRAGKGDAAADAAARKAVSEREQALWAGFATAEDKAGVAAAITTTTLERIKLEGSLKEAGLRKQLEEENKLHDSASRLQEKQREALTEQLAGAHRLRELAKSITQTLAETDASELSPLNFNDQLSAARDLFMKSVQGAQSGDEEAARNVLGNYRAYLQEGQQFHGGATKEYANLYGEARGMVEQLGLSAAKADPAGLQAQLDGLKALEEAARQTRDTVVDTSEEQIRALGALAGSFDASAEFMKADSEQRKAEIERQIKEQEKKSEGEKAILLQAIGAVEKMEASLAQIKDLLEQQGSGTALAKAAPKVTA